MNERVQRLTASTQLQQGLDGDTHHRIHLLSGAVERIRHLPSDHDGEVHAQQHPHHHEQLVILDHLQEDMNDKLVLNCIKDEKLEMNGIPEILSNASCV